MLFLLAWILHILNSNCNIVSTLASSGHFGAQFELHSLFAQDPLKLFGYLAVNAQSSDGVHVFDSGHFRPQTTPYGTQLKSNNSGSNYNHLLGHFLQAESPRTRHNCFLVHFNTREWRHF
uniref:Secreted protein n=1 Tax=Cacopsylla melanoneura TaxID=428564 RepID=A0A8D9ANV8_9HEMI